MHSRSVSNVSVELDCSSPLHLGFEWILEVRHLIDHRAIIQQRLLRRLDARKKKQGRGKRRASETERTNKACVRAAAALLRISPHLSHILRQNDDDIIRRIGVAADAEADRRRQ